MSTVQAAVGLSVLEMLSYAMSMEVVRIVKLATDDDKDVVLDDLTALLSMALGVQMSCVQWQRKPEALLAMNATMVREQAKAAAEAHGSRVEDGGAAAARALIDGIRLQMEHETGSVLEMPELGGQSWLGFVER